MPDSQTDADHAADPIDEVLIDALSRGFSHERAGALIDRSARTVARRLRDPAFAASVTQRRHEHASQIRSRHDELASQALEVLQDCLQSEDDRVRLAAARAALQQHRTNRHDLDITERLDELEGLALLDRPKFG